MRQRRQSKRRRTPRPSSKISRHFSKKDFLCPQAEKGDFRISLGLVGVLEHIRTESNSRIQILKGYESAHANAKITKKNYHHLGLAADITINDWSLLDSFNLVKEIDDIKGIGINLSEKYIHIDTRKQDERKIWVEVDGSIIDVTEDNWDSYLKQVAELSD